MSEAVSAAEANSPPSRTLLSSSALRLESHDLLFDGVLGDQSVDHHVAGLVDAVDAVDGLCLGCRVPPRVEQMQ